MTNDINKWHRRFLEDARLKASFSKDPGTQVGCVIIDEFRNPLSFGYNGLSPNMEDDPELLSNRELKLKCVIHAEINAILRARADFRTLRTATLFVWPFQPCDKCAPVIDASGIRRVVAPKIDISTKPAWEESFAQARWYFEKTGVELILLDEDD